MFRVVTYNCHFGVVYDNCSAPCDKIFVPCVYDCDWNNVDGAHTSIGVCRCIRKEDYVVLAEYLKNNGRYPGDPTGGERVS
jgi:hypothetical protein